MAGSAYFGVLTEAINDLLEHGFTDADQVARWQQRLQVAARDGLTGLDRLTANLSGSLRAIYRRLVENDGALKHHPGVDRFTYQLLKPRLRAELDKRILASVDLIRLNRDEAIARQLKRFSGWATSIPSGGAAEAGRRALKQEIRKPLARLPFEERRVMIDQGAKLAASIHSVIAQDAGAIAARWRHVRHMAGYQARPEHVARDGKVFLVRGSWADEANLLDGTYTDEIEQPAEFPFCFPGDSAIPFAEGVRKGYRRWYSGDLTKVVTASGKTLRATPNHPVLTTNGWVAIGALKEGDYLIEAPKYGVETTKPDVDDAVPTIAEVFRSLDPAGVLSTVGGHRGQFHGDGSEQDVNVVTAAGELTFWSKAALPQRRQQLRFAIAQLGASARASLQAFALRRLASGASEMRRLREAASTLWAFAIHADEVGFATAAHAGASLFQSKAHYATAHGETTGNRQFALPASVGGQKRSGIDVDSLWADDQPRAPVETGIPRPVKQRVGMPTDGVGAFLKGLSFAAKPTKVVKVERSSFAGHVYNLETADGWYVAGGIIAHNCRCSYVYLYGLRRLPPELLTAKGRDELQRLKEAA